MANRYWVGGTGSWDGAAGTKWSATSGGAGGASVPTTADDVFFDASSVSGSDTITIATGNTGAKSINCTGFTRTITGTAAITVAGSVTLASDMTWTHTGVVTFTGAGTLITAGKIFSAVVVNGTGITLTLGDALNTGFQDITVTRGTFNTANFAVTANALNSNNTNTRTITLGSSTVTLSGSSVISFSSSLTFNANTSQINVNPLTSASFFGGGKTFYNVTCSAAPPEAAYTLVGSNTFNNLTLISPTSGNGFSQLILRDDQTVSGTLTCAGATALLRCFVRSETSGTARTITVGTISAANCDFRDITLAGAASGAAPTRAGDCGGNSNITFPAAKTVYRVGTNTTWGGSSSWATTSGGTGANNNIPLAQDTCVINNSTALTGTLTVENYNIGAFDCSTRTTAITLNYGGATTWYGSHTFSSSITVSGTVSQTFAGRGTMDFTSAGKTITFPVTVQAPGGTFRLKDAFNSSNTVTHSRGTFDANNYNLTCTTFNSNPGGTGNTRTLAMGAGLWTLSGISTVWATTNAVDLTLNKGTANILLSNTSTAARTFAGGGLSYNKLTIGGTTGTSTTIVSGANSFTELASTKTVAHTVVFTSNQGTIDVWSITGTSGSVVTVNSSPAGTRRTFALTNITSGIDYLSVKDIGETTGGTFYVGANSTDGGNNSNVIFTASPITATGSMLMLF